MQWFPSRMEWYPHGLAKTLWNPCYLLHMRVYKEYLCRVFIFEIFILILYNCPFIEIRIFYLFWWFRVEHTHIMPSSTHEFLKKRHSEKAVLMLMA